MLELRKPNKSQNSVSGTICLTFMYLLKLLLLTACPASGFISKAEPLKMTELTCAKLLTAVNKNY